MYPRLIDCRVRGDEGDFYLHQYRDGREFALEPIHAKILLHCNGATSIEQLSVEFAQPKDDVVTFLRVFETERLLEFLSIPELVELAPLGGTPYLREVHIDATGWCNLYGICKHCYGRKDFQEATKNELSFAELCGVIDQMGEMNVADCVLSGGEVFIRKDIPQVILHLAKRCVHVTGIFTNGTIYRQDVIGALQAVGMKTFFFVSLDGHTARINDFLRGAGNFGKTLSFIRKIKDSGFPVIVNTMVIKQNVGHLLEMCHFLEELGIDRWRLSVPREQGETIVHKELILPKWQDVFDSYEVLLKHALTKTLPMKMQIGSIFKSELLEEPIYYLFRPSSNCCEYKRWSLVVKPNGNVTPCTAFENLVLGNIRQTSLRDIWKSDLTQAFKNLPISATDCRDCTIKEYCGAGCRKIAWELHRNVLAKDDNSCPLYEFADRLARPLLEAHGIKAVYLEEQPLYQFDPGVINLAIF